MRNEELLAKLEAARSNAFKHSSSEFNDVYRGPEEGKRFRDLKSHYAM